MQLDLFPEPPLDLSADAALAAARPPHVRFGTSSWTFRGWAGIVYRGRPTQEALVEKGLREYAAHPLFQTVGIDRSFYAPLDEAALKAMAAQLPPHFPTVMKVWSAITSPLDSKTGGPGPLFLHGPTFQEAVSEPVRRHFLSHLGALLFQVPPFGGAARLSPEAFTNRLGAFLRTVPPELRVAVEVRNKELLTPAYFRMLHEVRASHVYNHWEKMPPLSEQRRLPGAATTDFAVCRLMLPQGVGYEEAREAFEPFDRLQAVDEPMRRSVIDLIDDCAIDGRILFVLANNKAEGSSPLTIRGLLQKLHDRSRSS